MDIAACVDFAEFQERLKKMRDIDDKIVYALNLSVPTESFKAQISGEDRCKNLYNDLKLGNQNRQTAIKDCIVLTADNVKSLKNDRDKDRDDIQLDKHFKAEQRKLRMLQSELNVEDIIKDRTLKIFNERCRLYFKADTL